MGIEEYFGKRDAEQEDAESLAKYFYPLDLLDKVKESGKSKGVCIVVGVKGSGKTAICRWLEMSHIQTGIGLRLKISDGFSVENEKKLSSFYSSLLNVLLLSRLVDQIRDNKDKFSKKALNALPNALEKFHQLTTKILKRTKIAIGTDGLGLELDVGQLLEEGQRELSQVKIEMFKEMLTPCLSERRGFILIDDVDEIFPGSDVNYEFIEGLIASAVEINNIFGNLLHCLVFLKAGAYSRYFEHGRNYDKYADAAVVIRWGVTELIDMLATRSRVTTGKEYSDEEAWKSLQYSFQGDKKDIEEIQKYMVSRCNSGPRDMIIFANMAKQTAGDRKISLDDLRKIESQYSKEKLYQLNRDYQRQYGDIANLLAKVFRNRTAVYPKGKLEEFIQTELLGNAEIVGGDFGSMELIRYADTSRIMEKLFDFGFIGFRDTARSDFLYMMDMQAEMVEPSDRLFHAFEHRIHPAYESYLRLSPISTLSVKKHPKKS
jgi:hypothetical protein